jgi:hypothetical protein
MPRTSLGGRCFSERKTASTKLPPSTSVAKKMNFFDLKSNPLVSPAKRRLDFEDPSATRKNKPVFVQPKPPVSRVSESSSSSTWFVHEELDKVSKEQVERWNFDFVKGVPLPGRYVWEPVSPGTGSVTGSHDVTTPEPSISVTNDVEFFLADEISACELVDDDMTGAFVISPAKSLPGDLKSVSKQLRITGESDTVTINKTIK